MILVVITARKLVTGKYFGRRMDPNLASAGDTELLDHYTIVVTGCPFVNFDLEVVPT